MSRRHIIMSFPTWNPLGWRSPLSRKTSTGKDASAPRVAVPSVNVGSPHFSAAQCMNGASAGESRPCSTKSSTLVAPWRAVTALRHSNVMNGNAFLSPAFSVGESTRCMQHTAEEIAPQFLRRRSTADRPPTRSP